MELDIWVCPVCEQDNSSKIQVCSNCGYEIKLEELEEEHSNDFLEIILLDEEEEDLDE